MRLVIAVAVLLAPACASADWQYTRWGMTKEEVAAASKGQLKPCDARCASVTTDNSAAGLVGPYKSGEFNFDAFAMFDKRTGKLVRVNLKLLAGDGNALLGAVRLKYGEPASRLATDFISVHTWRDQGDEINIVRIGRDLTALTYEPRITESNKGL